VNDKGSILPQKGTCLVIHHKVPDDCPIPKTLPKALRRFVANDSNISSHILRNTMETLYSLSRIVHIAAGTLAFVGGLTAMLAPKGKTLHKKIGLVYVCSMLCVALTAVLMSLVKTELLTFFVPLSFFTLQLTLGGWRALERKKIRSGSIYQIPVLDWVIVIVSLLAGCVFVGLGIWRWVQGGVMGIVSAVFGVVGIVRAVSDIRLFRNIQRGVKLERMEWWFAHMSGMLGAYIATVTAVLVVNGAFLPPLVRWLAPTVLGTVGVIAWSRHYRRKFERA
jgi:uncharacterized membrane protein